MEDLFTWWAANGIGLVACLYALECILAFVSRFTAWKWDDNLAGGLAEILKKLFPKK